MELLAQRDVKRLAQLCGDTEARCQARRSRLIARLEPKPGRRFVDVERNVVVPDVLVTKVGRGAQARFQVQLNPDVMPRLRVHDIYASALKPHKGEGHQALQQRLQEARWFIKNIQQRFDTILRVSSAIVERQKNFFMHGELAMRPLVLREIADELGLHESTISRVTTAKYMSHALRHLRAQVLLRLGAGHRDRRQRVEHRGARADQAVRRRREPEEAAVRQPDLRHAQGAGHRVRAPHRGQVPRGAAHRARQPAQKRYS